MLCCAILLQAGVGVQFLGFSSTFSNFTFLCVFETSLHSRYSIRSMWHLGSSIAQLPVCGHMGLHGPFVAAFSSCFLKSLLHCGSVTMCYMALWLSMAPPLWHHSLQVALWLTMALPPKPLYASPSHRAVSLCRFFAIQILSIASLAMDMQQLHVGHLLHGSFL